MIEECDPHAVVHKIWITLTHSDFSVPETWFPSFCNQLSSCSVFPSRTTFSLLTRVCASTFITSPVKKQIMPVKRVFCNFCCIMTFSGSWCTKSKCLTSVVCMMVPDKSANVWAGCLFLPIWKRCSCMFKSRWQENTVTPRFVNVRQIQEK